MVPAFKCTRHLPNTMFVFAVIIYLAIDVSRATLLPSNSSKYHLEATNSLNCINIYLAACDPSDSCTVEFTQMKQKTDGSNDILKEDAIKPVTTADNSSYVFCIYDPVVSINASCCKYPVSGRNGSLSLKYGFISFMSKTCVTGSGNCVIRDSRKYVLPLSHDVCLSLTPCRNGGTCHATGGFLYTCACPGGLKGEKCDEPVGYEKIGYICLATNESLANVKNKTVSECASLCDNTKRTVVIRMWTSKGVVKQCLISRNADILSEFLEDFLVFSECFSVFSVMAPARILVKSLCRLMTSYRSTNQKRLHADLQFVRVRDPVLARRSGQMCSQVVRSVRRDQAELWVCVLPEGASKTQICRHHDNGPNNDTSVNHYSPPTHIVVID
ncbi:predicted protein [Nematostella vectensis]|uniref:EGF-like domain-containing protein n=1 Tax=Nematostella vectensis TaxID=45351 RepID=A7SFS3_NEMVE|nr:predicted protein [Nematostella vectensis]|eukprot:XP_001629523.1 predicted protein [Nematostella vectensis]